MQNIDKAFSCLRQILNERGIETHSKAATLSESAVYMNKLVQQVQLMGNQNCLLRNNIRETQQIQHRSEHRDERNANNLHSVIDKKKLLNQTQVNIPNNVVDYLLSNQSHNKIANTNKIKEYQQDEFQKVHLKQLLDREIILRQKIENQLICMELELQLKNKSK